MNPTLLAVFIQESTRFLSGYLRTRPLRVKVPSDISSVVEVTQTIESHTEEAPEEDGKVATGCVPCAIGHYGTCSGVLNEAMRFARNDGMESEEVIDRVNMCLDELNSMERIDLRPEKIAKLPKWEKALAVKALDGSRATRHQLESISTVEDLEQAAATTQTVRQDIGRDWFQQKFKRMKPDEKARVRQKVKELEEEG